MISHLKNHLPLSPSAPTFSFSSTAQVTKADFQSGEGVNPTYLLPYHSYLIKITQINANEDGISSVNAKNGRGGKRDNPQKFKLYAVACC